MELEGIFEVVLRRHQEKYGLNATEGHEILHANFLEEDSVVSIVTMTIIIVGIGFGVVGNILIIGGVSVYQRLRTTGNVFIVNLAVTDLIVVTVVQPFNVIGIVIGPQFFHGHKEALCHMVATVCDMSCACSMMSLAAIALNRYIYVCHKNKYHIIYSKRKMVIYIAIIWTTVALVDLPNYLGWGGHTFDYKTMSCVFDRRHMPYTMFLSTVIYWVPLSLVFVCYVSIFVFVKRHRMSFNKKFTNSESKNNNVVALRQQQDLRLIRTVILVVTVFICCWVPYFVLVLFDREENVSKPVYAFSLAFGHWNSSINSILYGATNQEFRKGYKMFLTNYCCFWCLKPKSSDKNFDSCYVSNISTGTLKDSNATQESLETE